MSDTTPVTADLQVIRDTMSEVALIILAALPPLPTLVEVDAFTGEPVEAAHG